MTERRFTLMTVHAHPDDETIGTGGTMARSVAEGHRVVLVTCTRGELGEIVVPEWDTPEGHRRLGDIRAAELEAAMGELGVTEWESLGYRDSDMMGRPGNLDARSFWQADPDDAARRLVWLIRTHRPDVVTTYNDFGGYGHPDHIRTHTVAVAAFGRAGETSWYPEQLAPEHGGSGAAAAAGGLQPWQPAKLYEQVIPDSIRNAIRERLEALGEPSFWTPPEGASPAELAAFEERMARMAVPRERVTTRVDISSYLEAKLRAMQAHRTQISAQNPFMRFGIEAWREFWTEEHYVLREARVERRLPESSLFDGLDAGVVGPEGWGAGRAVAPAETGGS